jgi:hypothetical protein
MYFLLFLVRSDAPNGGRINENPKCYGHSFSPVNQQTSHQASRCHSMKSSSLSPDDTAVVLNLALPRRRTQTPHSVSTESRVPAHCDARSTAWSDSNAGERFAALSVAAPPRAHCNEWRSPVPKDMLSNKTFGSDSSRYSEVQPWTYSIKEESNETCMAEAVGANWTRDHSDVCVTPCNPVSEAPAAISPSQSCLTRGCEVVYGKQGLLPLQIQVLQPYVLRYSLQLYSLPVLRSTICHI